MSYRLLVVAVVAACNSPSSSVGLEVFPGVNIDAEEGEANTEHFLRFDGEQLDIDQLAPPVAADDTFEATLIEKPDGDVHLSITPRCSAIPEGSTETLTKKVFVSMKGSDAEPTVVSVHIRHNEERTCAVQAVAWAGGCMPGMPRPDEAGSTIRLDTESTDQKICVEVTVPDSLASIDVTFPNVGAFDFLDAAAVLPWTGLTPTDPANPWRYEISTLGVKNKFRGEAELFVGWTGGGSQKLTLIAGEPGDGLLRIRSQATGVAEYGPKVFRFTSSYYAKPDTVACVRATPRGPTSMTLIARSEFAEIVQQGDIACGVDLNTVELLTQIDSAEHEYIDVGLEECTRPTGCSSLTDTQCCSLPEAQLRRVADGEIDVPSRSTAETIAIAQPGQPNLRACVDLDADDVPEVIVRDALGTRLHSATTPSINNVRFDPGTTIETPTSMQAIRWDDGIKASPILIGEFPNAPFLRTATKTGWDTAEWQPKPVSMDHVDKWVPIASKRTEGASYLAVQKTLAGISLVCVSASCRGDTRLIDASAIGGVATANTRVSGFAAADIDGDLDLDLVVSVDNGAATTAPKMLQIYAYDLTWQGNEITDVASEPVAYPSASTGIPWDRLQIVALPSPANGDIVYTLARGTIDQHAIVEAVPCGPGCRSPHLLDTISRPFEIANVANRLFVATDLGIWELNAQTWLQRDPERALTGQALPIPTGDTYGRVLRNCLLTNLTPVKPASILFDAETTARWTFADVFVDALPEP